MTKSKLKLKAFLDNIQIYDAESDIDKIDNAFEIIKKKVN